MGLGCIHGVSIFSLKQGMGEVVITGSRTTTKAILHFSTKAGCFGGAEMDTFGLGCYATGYSESYGVDGEFDEHGD